MYRRIVRTRLLAATVALGAFALAGLPALAGAKPAALAHAASTCGVGTGQGYNYSYLTSLSVSHTSCATGRDVAKHHGHVRGWSCHSKRLDSSPVQYDDKVTCHSGIRQVVWTYTENT